MSEAPAGPRQRSDARKNRAALLAAARELVAETGPQSLTVVAVAKRAGLNRGTAYLHFKTRDQLLQAIGDSFSQDVRDFFVDMRPFSEQLDYLIHYLRENSDMARIWMFQLLKAGVNRPP